MKRIGVALIICVLAAANFVWADTIRGINIEFVTIGHAGNPGDTRTEAYPYGCGAVANEYRIGKYEITNTQWNAFVAAAGAPTGSPSGAYDSTAYYTGVQRPTSNVSWYEVLQFCNFLTSGDKSKGAYQFSGNNANPGNFLGINRDAARTTYGMIYFLPTENEWYKAAYFKSNGSGYSLYANGQNTLPTPDLGWNYDGGAYRSPWNVGTGTMEQNGTYDMMGNLYEWTETPNNYTGRIIRGGAFNYSVGILASSYQNADNPDWESIGYGFRIASIPEPATLSLLALGGLALLRKRK